LFPNELYGTLGVHAKYRQFASLQVEGLGELDRHLDRVQRGPGPPTPLSAQRGEMLEGPEKLMLPNLANGRRIVFQVKVTVKERVGGPVLLDTVLQPVTEGGGVDAR